MNIDQETRRDQEHLAKNLEQALEDWWRLASAGHKKIHLYYRPTDRETGEGGEVRAAIEAPEGFLRGSMQELSPAWDRDRARARIREELRSLPILPTRPDPDHETRYTAGPPKMGP